MHAGSRVQPSAAGPARSATRWWREIPHIARSFVRSSKRRTPVTLVIAFDLDVPGLTTDGAVLHVRLPPTSRLVHIDLGVFSAIWTADCDVLRHGGDRTSKFFCERDGLARFACFGENPRLQEPEVESETRRARPQKPFGDIFVTIIWTHAHPESRCAILVAITQHRSSCCAEAECDSLVATECWATRRPA